MIKELESRVTRLFSTRSGSQSQQPQVHVKLRQVLQLTSSLTWQKGGNGQRIHPLVPASI